MSQVQNSQTVITASGLFTVNKTILSSVSICSICSIYDHHHIDAVHWPEFFKYVHKIVCNRVTLQQIPVVSNRNRNGRKFEKSNDLCGVPSVLKNIVELFGVTRVSICLRLNQRYQRDVRPNENLLYQQLYIITIFIKINLDVFVVKFE